MDILGGFLVLALILVLFMISAALLGLVVWFLFKVAGWITLIFVATLITISALIMVILLIACITLCFVSIFEWVRCYIFKQKNR